MKAIFVLAFTALSLSASAAPNCYKLGVELPRSRSDGSFTMPTGTTACLTETNVQNSGEQAQTGDFTIKLTTAGKYSTYITHYSWSEGALGSTYTTYYLSKAEGDADHKDEKHLPFSVEVKTYNDPTLKGGHIKISGPGGANRVTQEFQILN